MNVCPQCDFTFTQPKLGVRYCVQCGTLEVDQGTFGRIMTYTPAVVAACTASVDLLRNETDDKSRSIYEMLERFSEPLPEPVELPMHPDVPGSTDAGTKEGPATEGE